ncbi:DENN domain-containing protein C297.05 [Colletotrichum liriopes]|uniref:DENN domain-containing protein C297.05 n=1 Tax=Colletotrichum liriopes TaxID=708192 RepID=A0AA37LSC5_9PEZI|nr:DENN domain-containing protein C297.05 [Colletotrichum liriopes]
MESSSTPLADYFWIAGVEAVSYQDSTPQPPSNLESTIAEDSEYEESDTELNATPSKRVARHSSVGRHSRQNSGGRTSNGRFSIHTLDEVDGNTRSNRSSATIRPSHASQINGSSGGNGLNIFNGLPGLNGLNAEGQFIEGFDFDKALLKFAAERENFLEDLSFSAGARTQARPPMVNPRAERIKADEGDMSGRRSPLRSIERSIKGSIRRKMSFRDMNSMRKQPTTPRASTPGAALEQLQLRHPSTGASECGPRHAPLKRRFEPVLLDRYPAKEATDEISRRGKFPDYVPMFAFPNDIQIVSSDERPRSTWHGFTMTSDDNSKIYGITIIVWTALTSEVADEVEKKCEQWRQSHMSNEERELAASLGVRLAAERAHLSQLLAKLPTIPSGSSARDILDDQISTVEEKISLMTEMLRPLRHGAASKIDGLTAGESGLWAPRAYGILGRDNTRMSFWKEWLRAVVVPMTDGAVLRVPPSSPKVGRWQPLERYVVNLCTEAFSPLGSKTQVELGVRELRLYCRKEAINEIPGARTIDIYALFRCLSVENIVALFEYAMSESRIIFMSSHTGMLHLACHALVNLLYPLKWASIFIPVLPARLISALEAPCPYIVGIERRYEKIELPDDDYVLVDLDMDTIDATAQPVRLPRQHRRKLISLLHVAAPHHIRYGVTTGPPPYAMESFPYDAFSVENDTLFNSNVASSSLGKWVTQNSSSFGEPDPPNLSGHFDEKSRRSSSFGMDKHPPLHRPSLPFLNGHNPSMSVSAVSVDSLSSYGGYTPGYAPSTYAQSTLAASTIMPNMLVQPVRNTDTMVWVEGHCFNWIPHDMSSTCSVCDEKSEGDGIYQCSHCDGHAHNRCLGQVSVVCKEAFHADRVRAAFVRCLASLLYTYRKHLGRPTREQKSNGQLYSFDMNGFIKSLPYDQQEYATMLRDTQAFNEFIHERETHSATHSSVRLFDEIIMAKKARGRPGLSTGFSRLSTIRMSHGASSNASGFAAPSKLKIPTYLGDTSDHMWRTASVPVPSAKFPGEYRTVVTRIPTKLDPSLMREPRAIQGVPRAEQRTRGLIRKQVPSMVGSPPN